MASETDGTVRRDLVILTALVCSLVVPSPGLPQSATSDLISCANIQRASCRDYSTKTRGQGSWRGPDLNPAARGGLRCLNRGRERQ